MANQTWQLEWRQGAGAWAAVPLTETSKVTPVVEAGDCTESGNNTASASWAISHPAYVAGDLVIIHLASDANVTHTFPSTGPNSETIVTIYKDQNVAGAQGPNVSVFYWVGTGTQAAGTVTVTPSASEQWTACALKVPAGEFDSATPIDSGVGNGGDGSGTASAAPSPAWSASSGAASGRVMVWLGVDADPITATPTGWTDIASTDRGAVSGTLSNRDTAASASESIASANWTIAADSSSSIGYIINAPSTTSDVWISASSNITAGGEATTAQLTAPGAKSSGTDFDTGRMWDDENGTDAVAITADDYTEVEWCLQFGASASGTYDFRVTDGGGALAAYSVTPQITIGGGGGGTTLKTNSLMLMGAGI